jgi:Uma2 family endonuclease
MHDIILPEAKPAFEWVNGRALQKLSPRRKHALAQSRFVTALDAWACEHSSGMAGTEWEFRLAPMGEIRRPLVPDVAYLSYERLPRELLLETDYPHVAPDVAVEILSPGDRVRDIEEKIRIYLACGTSVVFLVDTDLQTVTERDGGKPRIYSREDSISHRLLPGFAMQVRTLFEIGPIKR